MRSDNQDQTSVIDGGPVEKADITLGSSGLSQTVEAYIDEIKIFSRIFSVCETMILKHLTELLGSKVPPHLPSMTHYNI